jgi:hypothetical protein
MENWKPIPRDLYSDQYEISDKGNCRKMDKRILNQHIRNGYKAVSLYDPNTKKKNTVNIHRMVALAFIDNPNELKFINHKDGDKTNNHVENLEWISPKGNVQHAIKENLQKPHPKRVMQYTVAGQYTHTYNSILEASEKTGASARHISCVCKGKRKTTGGFVWKYETPEEVLQDVDGIQIEGFPNYKITKDGKVYSKKAKKFLIQKKLPSGYLCVKLCNNGVYKDVYIQKLVREHYETTIENLGPKSVRETTDGSGENSEV